MQQKLSPVCPGQIDPESANLGGQEEDEDVVVPVELVDDGMAGSDRRGTVLK